MSNHAVSSILVVCLYGNLFAADVAPVEKWTTEIASVFAKDLRSGLDQPFYANQLVGLDRDAVAQQISNMQAACWVEALMRLAQKHSIRLEDIFVGAQGDLINTDLLPENEVNKETADCARNAFHATGIDYD